MTARQVRKAQLALLTEIISLARPGIYANRVERGGKREYRPVKTSVSEAILEAHLDNEQPIGMYLVDGDQTKIGAFDIDDHNGDGDPDAMEDAVVRLVAAAVDEGLSPWVCSSQGGRGRHVFAFWREAQSAKLVRQKLRRIGRACGFKDGPGGLAAGQVEVFPKQDSVAEGKPGNLIALPLALKSRPMDGVTLQAIELENYLPAPLPISRPVEPGTEEKVSKAAGTEPRDESGKGARIKRLLDGISADDHDTWIKVGFAIKFELGDAGYGLWCEWSATSTKFSAEDCARRWRSMNPNGDACIATLQALARKPAKPLVDFIVTAEGLVSMEIEPRELIIDPFIPTFSLLMVYAERGRGKTWFALSLCVAICNGEKFLGHYDVPRPRTVLYIDGEMALPDLQLRVSRIAKAPPPNFMLLPSERLFREDRPLNINAADDQQRINEALDQLVEQGRRPDLIVFDNLSSLSGGVDENDNSALDALLGWLTGLRHRGYAVLLVHHAGKSGAQRGASRREDLLDTSILLKKPEGDRGEEEGAHAVLEFPKTRGKTPRPPSLEIWLTEGADGALTWTTRKVGKAVSEKNVLQALAARSFETQAELAVYLDRSQGLVSQIFKRLVKEGLVEQKPPTLTRAGRAYIAERFPDLAPLVAKQGDWLKRDDII